MKLSSRMTIAGAPEFEIRTRMSPLSFALAGEGTLEIGTGPIHAEVGEIPLSIRIPFLPAHRRVVAGSLGPFRIGIRPANATIRASAVRCEGTLATGEEGCALEGRARGTLEVELEGEIPGSILKAALEGAFEE